MDIEEIEVEILPDGTLQLSVKGVKGAACLDITHDLEQALGGKIITREMEPEALEALANGETIQTEQPPVRVNAGRRKKGSAA